MRKILILSFILFLNCAIAQPYNLLEPKKLIDIKNQPQKPDNYFSLANIVDTILNYDTEEKEDNTLKDSPQRKKFVSIASKFNQGNASSAYSEYDKFIDEIDSDISLLNLSKALYKIGFFTLAQKSRDKIVLKNNLEKNIKDLKNIYSPKSNLTQEDEIYFGKIYASIYFDNSSQEAIEELLEKKEQYSKNDYYDFMLSRAYFVSKKYPKALSYINKALSQNPENYSYELHKIDILIAQGKNKKAYETIEKLESRDIIDIYDDIEIKKQLTKASLAKNEKEKKYYALYKSYLEGNFEKTKKDCLSVLNFDKDNDKIISLYAKSELALGNIERANIYFINSYKIEKNNPDTLIGLGDIRYIHKDYKSAEKMYKKALKKDKNNFEILLKLANTQRQQGENQKALKKTEDKIDKLETSSNTQYLDYYLTSISLGQKNPVLKEEYLKRALEINPLYENAIGELIELDLRNKNFSLAKSMIDKTAFTLEKNYYYYYLLGLYNQAQNKTKDAIRFYKTSLNLNPNFEVANTKLLKLIPEKTDQEDI